MRALALAAASLLAAGCGIATHVRPTPRGAFEVEASAGGPLANLGAPIPIPLSTVGASYGFGERWDLQAHLHLTTLALKTAGADVGGSWLALEQHGLRPALSLTARAYAFSDLASAVQPYGELTATASWASGRWTAYGTASGMLDYGGRFLWSPGVGARVALGRFGAQLDLRWYEPAYSTAHSSVPWVGPGALGALGVVLGASYRFGELAPPSPPASPAG